jgi:uncharacterized protein (DUF3084 family)
MRFYLVLCLVVLPLSLSAEENIVLTPEQWQSLKNELTILRQYHEESESLLKEREEEYEQRQLVLKQRENRLNEKETALNEREKDLQLRESYQDERDRLLIESTDSLERLKKKIAILERDNVIWKVLTGLGGLGSASGWAAYSIRTFSASK